MTKEYECPKLRELKDRQGKIEALEAELSLLKAQSVIRVEPEINTDPLVYGKFMVRIDDGKIVDWEPYSDLYVAATERAERDVEERCREAYDDGALHQSKPVVWVREFDNMRGYCRCNEEGAPFDEHPWGVGMERWKKTFPDHDVRVWEPPERDASVGKCNACGQFLPTDADAPEDVDWDEVV